jgi:hypothetical protein
MEAANLAGNLSQIERADDILDGGTLAARPADEPRPTLHKER